MRMVTVDDLLKGIGIERKRDDTCEGCNHEQDCWKHVIYTKKDICEIVDELPYREEIRGQWLRVERMKKVIYDPESDWPGHAYRCSVCKRMSFFPEQYPDNFCKRCGATMEMEKESLWRKQFPR